MAAREESGPMLLVLQREKRGLESRGRCPEDGTAKEVESPLEPAGVTLSCRKLDFGPAEACLRLLTYGVVRRYVWVVLVARFAVVRYRAREH